MNKWQRKATALARLAEDQRGKPEGDLARQKLLEIINKHPEAMQFGPVVELAKRDMTMKDVAYMNKNGISTDGKWTADNLQAAVKKMEADYWHRIDVVKNGRLISD